jgi:MarR family transcriptional regulator, 2-MHQ and catechol-resistance regulon repressor
VTENLADDQRITAIGLLFEVHAGLATRFATQFEEQGLSAVEVDRMVRDGLVCRRACPTDRRSSYAVLTRAGQQRLDETLPRHLRLIEQWFTGQLAPAELAAFLDTLRRLRNAVHPGATAGSDGETAQVA